MAGRTQGRFHKIQAARNAKGFRELSDNMERREDPLEQATTHLRRRGYVVFRTPEGWTVGNRVGQSDGELVEIAKRQGWQPKARDRKKMDRSAGK